MGSSIEKKNLKVCFIQYTSIIPKGLPEEAFCSSESDPIKMQNPNEDTEWNDILRKKGIIPEKTPEPEISEETLVAMMDKKIKEMSGKKDLEDMNLEELDELEDEEDERILMEYRNQRLAE